MLGGTCVQRIQQELNNSYIWQKRYLHISTEEIWLAIVPPGLWTNITADLFTLMCIHVLVRDAPELHRIT